MALESEGKIFWEIIPPDLQSNLCIKEAQFTVSLPLSQLK